MSTSKRPRHDEPAQAPSPAEDAPDADAQENAQARRKREQWERDHAQELRERDEMRRALFTAFKIWTICPHKNCQRAQACRAADTEECRRERWRHVVTDEIRFVLSRMSQLISDDHPVREAFSLAQGEWRDKEKILAEIEARNGAPRPAYPTEAADAGDDALDEPPAPDTVPDDRGPRIRSL